MSLRRCSIKGCERRDIVALQRQIQVISLPRSSDPNQPSHTESIMFHYFCQIHFDRNELRKKNVRLLPASSLSDRVPNSVAGKEIVDDSKLKELLVNSGNGKQILNLNGKRKASDSENFINQLKPAKRINNENGKSSPLLLNEAVKSKGTTTANVLNNKKFHSKDDHQIDSAEDNDCIITEEPLETVIDLSDDDAEESNKMIELIMCDETELESTETTELSNECEGTDDVEPLDINFVSLNDLPSESVDFIDMQNEDILEFEVDDETKQSSDSATGVEKRCEKAVSDKAIDLTDEPNVDEEETNVDIEGFRLSVIREIRRRLDKKFPGFIQTVSWNDKSQQFEVSLSKQTGFKADDGFQCFLREVVNQAIQCNNDRVNKAKIAARCGKRKVYSRTNKNVVLNKEYTEKPQQVVLKRSESNRNGGSTTSTNIAPTSTNIPPTSTNIPPTSTNIAATSTNITPSTSGTQSTTKYNVNHILKKSESYLGVSAETFRQIENILPERLRNRYMLILLLRKLKLNESFTILSDGLRLDNGNGVKTFNKFLPLLSHTLKGLIQWPTNRREPLAIMDTLDIEIEKPKSSIQQHITFCTLRQRYLAKFIICVTSTGYITHISLPSQAIRAGTFMSCLRTIPHSSAVLANPILMESVTLSKRSRISSLYDFNHQTERKVFQRTCDYLRSFGLISGISHLKNDMLLYHALTVVACLCNLELKQDK